MSPMIGLEKHYISSSSLDAHYIKIWLIWVQKSKTVICINNCKSEIIINADAVSWKSSDDAFSPEGANV